jgi:hypothetical protein
MIGPPEPHPTQPRPVAGARRCLLLADGAPAGPALLGALRRLRAQHRGLVVHVVVPVRPALAAALAVGDPLAGWIVIDARAAHEWEQASRQDARRRLQELRWLLWEMDIASTGEVLAEEAAASLHDASSAGFDLVLVTRRRLPLARWRQARWLRRLDRHDRPVEIVEEPRRRRH